MKKLLLPVLFLLTAFFSFAQPDSVLKWQLSVEHISDSSYELKAVTTIPSDWYLYAVNPSIEALKETVLITYNYENAANAGAIVFTGKTKKITDAIQTPTIGIGAGRYCDGQVLVLHDVIGLSDFEGRMIKKYANVKEEIKKAVEGFKNEVITGKFPTEKNSFI